MSSRISYFLPLGCSFETVLSQLHWAQGLTCSPDPDPGVELAAPGQQDGKKVVELTPTMLEATESWEQAAEGVATLEVKVRKLSRSEIPKAIWEAYEQSPRIGGMPERQWRCDPQFS